MPELSEMFANPGPRWMQGPPNETAKWLEMGYAMGEERRQFDIYQQRLQALDAIQKRAKDQEYELNAITLRNTINDREQMIASEGAYSKVAKLMSDHSLAGIAGTDASEARIWSTIANNPSFYRHPASRDFLSKMQLSREAREKASERESLEIQRLSILEAGRAERALLDAEKAKEAITSREKIAETRSETDIQKAEIAAESKVRVATIAASKWKDHSRFAAFKSGLGDFSGLAKRDPEKYAEKVRNLYEQLLPSGEPNEWDSTPAPAVAPLDPMPKSKEEFDALPPGTWFINPADGKRMRKK